MSKKLKTKKLSFFDESDSRRSSLTLSEEKPRSSRKLLPIEKSSQKLPKIEKSSQKSDLKKSTDKSSFGALLKSNNKPGQKFNLQAALFICKCEIIKFTYDVLYASVVLTSLSVAIAAIKKIIFLVTLCHPGSISPLELKLNFS